MSLQLFSFHTCVQDYAMPSNLDEFKERFINYATGNDEAKHIAIMSESLGSDYCWLLTINDAKQFIMKHPYDLLEYDYSPFTETEVNQMLDSIIEHYASIGYTIKNPLTFNIYNTKQLGSFLKVQRKAKNHTLQQVADRLSISPSYVSRIENGSSIPSKEVYSRLLALLKYEGIQIEFSESLSQLNQISSTNQDELSILLEQNQVSINGEYLTSEAKKNLSSLLYNMYTADLSNEAVKISCISDILSFFKESF